MLAVSTSAPVPNSARTIAAVPAATSAGRKGASRQRSHRAETAPPQTNSDTQRSRPKWGMSSPIQRTPRAAINKEADPITSAIASRSAGVGSRRQSTRIASSGNSR